MGKYEATRGEEMSETSLRYAEIDLVHDTIKMGRMVKI
jgi:hypothetical protein